jgi:hypothetical protein
MIVARQRGELFVNAWHAVQPRDVYGRLTEDEDAAWLRATRRAWWRAWHNAPATAGDLAADALRLRPVGGAVVRLGAHLHHARERCEPRARAGRPSRATRCAASSSPDDDADPAPPSPFELLPMCTPLLSGAERAATVLRAGPVDPGRDVGVARRAVRRDAGAGAMRPGHDDQEVVRRLHLRTIVAHGGLIELRCFRQGRPLQEWHEEPAIASLRAGELAATHDVYVGVLARHDRRGGKDALQAGHVVIAACDSERSVEGLRTFPVRPSFVIESGGRDDDTPKLHAWWVLNDRWPTATLEMVTRQLAVRLGSDTRV